MTNIQEEKLKEFRDKYCIFTLNQADQQDWLLNGSFPMDWVKDWLTSAFHTIEEQGYERGKEDGRGEMVMNSQGFIEKAVLPAEMIEKVRAEAIEQTRKDDIVAVEKLKENNICTCDRKICHCGRYPTKKETDIWNDAIKTVLASLHKQD